MMIINYSFSSFSLPVDCSELSLACPALLGRAEDVVFIVRFTLPDWSAKSLNVEPKASVSKCSKFVFVPLVALRYKTSWSPPAVVFRSVENDLYEILH